MQSRRGAEFLISAFLMFLLHPSYFVLVPEVGVVNWWMAALGAAIVVALFGLLAAVGGLRWWQRRRPLLQLVLLVLIPALLIGLSLAVALQFTIPIESVAGLLFGVGIAAMLLLIFTSYLIEQIRVAWSPPDDQTRDE